MHRGQDDTDTGGQGECGNREARRAHLGCDIVLSFCKMLPLSRNQAKCTDDLSGLFLTVAFESIMTSVR